jgi:hypothetical protein
MAGCRAAEMAVGKHLEEMQRWSVRGREHLMQPRAHSLTDEQQDVLPRDFNFAFSRTEALVRLKTNFYNHLPWRLRGLSHWDTAVARQVARDSIETYDSLASGEAAAVNHRLAILLLDPRVPERQHLEAFINGDNMADFAGGGGHGSALHARGGAHH